MRGIQFNDHHSADDWGLILNSRKNTPPSPKYVRVSVDGRDGDLNLSRTLTGDIRYENRKVSYGFIATDGSQIEREELISNIINELHGQEIKIIEPDDPDHYLMGEVEVSDIHNNKAYSTFEVSANCEPYRYSINEVNRVITLTSEETNIILTNAGTKTLIPVIEVNGSVNIKSGSVEVALSSGSYKLMSFALKKGPTVITVRGSGTITVSYREAIL